MRDPQSWASDPTQDDFVLAFQIGDSAIRGRIVRLGSCVDDILRRKTHPTPVMRLAGEAAALTALLGAAQKHSGKLILQIRSDGPVRLLVAEMDARGGLRVCASCAEGAPAGSEPLIGEGHLAMTLDQGPNTDRYQGVVATKTGDLASNAQAYFDQSEQIPAHLKLAAGECLRPGDRPSWRAGGLLLQWPSREEGQNRRVETDREMEQDAWRRALALADTLGADELIDPTLPAGRLLYRLFHEDGVRIFEPKPLYFECSCARETVLAVLAQYPAEELDDMARNGVIEADCEFCGEKYEISVDETQRLGTP